MMRIIDVSMICFKSISLKKTFEEEEFEETDELEEDDDDDAEKRERN